VLLKKNCDLDVELIRSTGGVFEVVVNGRLVYSKKQTGEFPDEVQMVQRLSVSSPERRNHD
jgi:selenoprotein W-related protein